MSIKMLLFCALQKVLFLVKFLLELSTPPWAEKVPLGNKLGLKRLNDLLHFPFINFWHVTEIRVIGFLPHQENGLKKLCRILPCWLKLYFINLHSIIATMSLSCNEKRIIEVSNPGASKGMKKLDDKWENLWQKQLAGFFLDMTVKNQQENSISLFGYRWSKTERLFLVHY